MVFVSSRQLELRVTEQGVSQLGQEGLLAARTELEGQESCGLLFVTKPGGDASIPTEDQ